MFSSLSSLALLTVLPAPAVAAESEPGPKVELQGLVYSHWGLDLSDGARAYNEFALDRAYFGAKAQITPKLGARVMLDADHMKAVETDTGEFTVDTKYRVFVKYAWLEWKGLAPGVKLRAGVIDTPYQPVQDNFWGHRYVHMGLADQEKVLSTADLGVALTGDHAKGLVSWSAGVFNGEGYGKLEVDAGKSVQARFTLDPLAAQGKLQLPITGFVNVSTHVDADPTITYVGALGFKAPYLWFLGEYLGVAEGSGGKQGISVSALPGLPKYGRLVLRYDHYDPDTTTDDDGYDKLIGGVSHDFADKIAVAATYEREMPESASGDVTHGVFVHMQVGF